jgi:outer membrane protein assembly complex protein YaeT
MSVCCREDGELQVSALAFHGVKGVDEGSLRAALQTQKGSRFPWGRKRYFDRRAFDADLKRIQAFYRDRGFPDARVTSFDVKLNQTQNKVAITVNIAEGDPIRVAGVELKGFDVLPANVRSRLPTQLPLEPNHPLDHQLAIATRERVTNVLRDHGYAYADVTMEEQEVGPKRTRLVFTAKPGPLTHFGTIEVTGEKSVGEEVILRQLLFAPGDVYSRERIRNSQQKIYGLELFQFVNIEPQTDQATEPTEIPMRVVVGETKHQKVTFGAGYGTEEKVRARIRWDNVNFLGGARHAGVEGKWSSLDRGVHVDLTEPYVLSPHFSATLDGRAWHASEPVYTLDSVGARLTLKHQADPQTSWAASFGDEYQRSTIVSSALTDPTIRSNFIALGLDPTTGESLGTLAAVGFDLTRNTTRNLLDAHNGYMATVHLEQAGKWLWGQFNYWLVSSEGRYYQPLGRRAVLAARLQFGVIDPFGGNQDNVPFYKRFFLGGASSVRGWGRYELSPLSGGLPVGGDSMFEGSTELRFPISSKFAGVAFLDLGNVWTNPWAFVLGDLHYAVGPGLRYLTPVGPARVDFGYQLNPLPGLLVDGVPQTRQWRVHFSIGQAF